MSNKKFRYVRNKYIMLSLCSETLKINCSQCGEKYIKNHLYIVYNKGWILCINCKEHWERLLGGKNGCQQ